MKKTKHSEEKIIAAVKQLEAGRSVKELARELGVTDQTLYNWKSKYSGIDVSDAKRVRAERVLGGVKGRPVCPQLGTPRARRPSLSHSFDDLASKIIGREVC